MYTVCATHLGLLLSWYGAESFQDEIFTLRKQMLMILPVVNVCQHLKFAQLAWV